MTGAIVLRPTTMADAPAVLALHIATASAPGSGLARAADEMVLEQIEAALGRALASGIAISAWAHEACAGEIHASRLGPRQFAHNLLDLTVAVHPEWQGQGIGARLFEALFAAARDLEPAIERIELMCSEGNDPALRLYQRLGFQVEGRFPGRIRASDGSVQADLALAKVV
jgi:putative acetyltransferase